MEHFFKFGDKLTETQAKNINPIVLAYVGDAVYSLFVREKLVFTTNMNAGALNKLAVKDVNAQAQAVFIEKIFPLLNQVEQDVFRYARNSKKNTRAKSASVSEYNKSTGFEAVLGFLWLTGNVERINYLLTEGEDK